MEIRAIYEIKKIENGWLITDQHAGRTWHVKYDFEVAGHIQGLLREQLGTQLAQLDEPESSHAPMQQDVEVLACRA